MTMPRSFEPYRKKHFSPSFYQLYQPLIKTLQETPILEFRGDRPLQMTFENQLKALIFFHLEGMGSTVDPCSKLIRVKGRPLFPFFSLFPLSRFKHFISEVIHNNLDNLYLLRYIYQLYEIRTPKFKTVR